MTPWKQFLEKNYFDLGNPASFVGPQKLYRYSKEEGYFDVTKNQVATWLKNKDAYSLHRQSRKPKRHSRVVVEGIDSQWDVDLMDVGSLAKKNDGIKFLLVAIDVFSKYLFVRPLKNKTGKEVEAALEDIFRKGRKPKKCRFDQGKEFSNKQVQGLLKDEKIEFYTSQNETKANFAERVIKTLKKMIYRYITHYDKEKYIDHLEELVRSYNYSYHRTIGMPPARVGRSNERSVWWYSYWPEKDENFRLKPYKFKVGDNVRVTHTKTLFDREYDFKWTGEIFKIRARYKRDGINVYRLKDFLDKDIKGSFYEAELQKVEQSDENRKWKISKVLKTRKTKSRKEHLVRWLHWPKKFDSWVADKDLKSL